MASEQGGRPGRHVTWQDQPGELFWGLATQQGMKLTFSTELPTLCPPSLSSHLLLWLFVWVIVFCPRHPPLTYRHREGGSLGWSHHLLLVSSDVVLSRCLALEPEAWAFLLCSTVLKLHIGNEPLLTSSLLIHPGSSRDCRKSFPSSSPQVACTHSPFCTQLPGGPLQRPSQVPPLCHTLRCPLHLRSLSDLPLPSETTLATSSLCLQTPLHRAAPKLSHSCPTPC